MVNITHLHNHSALRRSVERERREREEALLVKVAGELEENKPWHMQLRQSLKDSYV
jgi:hypothetical protein